MSREAYFPCPLSIGRTSKMSSNEKKTSSSTSSRIGRTVSNGGTDSSGGGSLGSVPVKIVAGPYSLREGIHHIPVLFM